jgi:L,D-peptidoglycan transpeptidase YkuD (ErfK/YbiS/YcfS/YnhG family)
MIILVKNKHTLQIDEFKFKCCIGKKGSTKNKREGDKKTPIGVFKLGNLYYREDRISIPETKLKCIKISKNMGWCDDQSDHKNYNKLINTKFVRKYEKLYREDYKYDLLMPIKYNFKKPIPGNGSCIFLHLTKSYAPTAGCVALSKKDFMILLKIVKVNSSISIL